jgi:hypothetical protein
MGQSLLCPGFAASAACFYLLLSIPFYHAPQFILHSLLDGLFPVLGDLGLHVDAHFSPLGL